jgi:hypothetical protein
VTDVKAFPDVEIELIALLAQAFSDYRFVSKMPGEITNTTARIHRISGANRDITIDRPIVDVDVFAVDEATSSSAARSIQAALLSLRGAITTNGVIQQAVCINGPRWLAEANTNFIRYGSTYEIHIRS